VAPGPGSVVTGGSLAQEVNSKAITSSVRLQTDLFIIVGYVQSSSDYLLAAPGTPDFRSGFSL
jgi:hypothetical protein